MLRSLSYARIRFDGLKLHFLGRVQAFTMKISGATLILIYMRPLHKSGSVETSAKITPIKTGKAD